MHMTFLNTEMVGIFDQKDLLEFIQYFLCDGSVQNSCQSSVVVLSNILKAKCYKPFRLN